MLADRYTLEELAALLRPGREFQPIPAAGDRAAWESVPEALKARWLREGEAYLGYPWPTLPATAFLEYARTGGRQYDSLYQLRRSVLGCLVVCECLEGQGRFVDDIVNGIYQLCEETTWCLPAHMSLSRGGDGLADPEDPVVDLFAADTGALLAWTACLLMEALDQVSPQICRRIRQEVRKRVLLPYEKRDDFWWMGFAGQEPNNWNPWCNSNVLAAVLLLEDDEERRSKMVHRIMRSLDTYLAVQYEDGGCDEGATYWNVAAGSLFDALELLYLATGGDVNLYDQPLIRRLGGYIAKMFIHGPYFVNFADGAAKPRLDYALIWRYGHRIGDRAMMEIGRNGQRTKASVYDSGHIFFLFRELAGLRSAAETGAEEFGQSGHMHHRRTQSGHTQNVYIHHRHTQGRDAWLDQIQVMTAREREDGSGLFVAAKGGHNGESHNHNDVGQFVVYADGEPFLIDAGVENYSAKTFGPERYSLWTMQSGYHNLPTINGLDQQEGRAFRARDVFYEANESKAMLTMDMAGAYSPESGLRQWRRTVTLHRGREAFVELAESCEFAGNPVSVVLNWLSCRQPDIATKGVIKLSGGATGHLQILYEEQLFSISVEQIAIQDSRLQEVWGDRLYRIRMTPAHRALRAEWQFKIKQVSCKPDDMKAAGGKHHAFGG